MKIKNFTPHPVTLRTNSNEVVAVFESEGIARVATSSVQVGEINGTPLYVVKFGNVIDLPEK